MEDNYEDFDPDYLSWALGYPCHGLEPEGRGPTPGANQPIGAEATPGGYGTLREDDSAARTLRTCGYNYNMPVFREGFHYLHESIVPAGLLVSFPLAAYDPTKTL